MDKSENDSLLSDGDKSVEEQRASTGIEELEEGHDDDERNSDEDDATDLASEEAAKKPMSFKAKVCLNTSLSLVLLSVFFAAGVFDRFPNLLFDVIPAFWEFMLSEHPFLTSGVTIGATLILSIVLFEKIPEPFKPFSVIPFTGVLLFWLIHGWQSMAKQPGSVFDMTGILLVGAACTVVGFCCAVHSGEKGMLEKIGDFVFISTITNGGAIVLCAMISWLIPSEQAYTRAVEKETRSTRLAYQIMGSCTDFKSQEFCDALKIVEDEITASK